MEKDRRYRERKRMDNKSRNILLVIVVLSLTVVSCVVSQVDSKISSHHEVVDQEGTESVSAEILMGAGKLVVQSGTDSLMEGNFTYSHRDYAPDISYRVNGGQGYLQVEQEDGPRFNIQSNYKNDWELIFNEEISLEMEITLGAGESILDLAELNLESLNIKMGAGALSLDLSDDLNKDLTVNIQGGVGELTLFLPPDTNIEAEVSGGLGEINTRGLDRNGDWFVSKDSGSRSTLSITIEVGIGQLNLLVQ